MVVDEKKRQFMSRYWTQKGNFLLSRLGPTALVEAAPVSLDLGCFVLQDQQFVSRDPLFTSNNATVLLGSGSVHQTSGKLTVISTGIVPFFKATVCFLQH